MTESVVRRTVSLRGAMHRARAGTAQAARAFWAALLLACLCPVHGALEEADPSLWPSVAGEGMAVRIADFTGDGQPEILCGQRAGIRLLRRQAGGGFAELPDAVADPAGRLTDLLPIDADRDGDLDIVLLSATEPARLLRNAGDGTFPVCDARELAIDTAEATCAATADLDGDGWPDLVLGRRKAPPLWLRNSGGVFRGASWGTPPPGNAAVAVAAADLDGDGWLDLAIFDRNDGVAILLNNGTGLFAPSPAPLPPMPERIRTGTLADLDGDGHVDLIGAGATGIFVWRNQGDGAFAAVPVPALDAAVLRILPCDLTADGFTDLYLACAGQDLALVNDGSGAFALDPALLPANDSRSFAGASGDVNGDLCPDIALAVPDGADRLLLSAFDAPVVLLSAPAQAVLGQPFLVQVSAADPDGIASLTLTANGLPVAITDGQATYTAASAGPVDFVATARDTLDNETVAGPRRTAVVGNLPPQVDAGPNLTLLVNQPLAANGQVADPGSTSWNGTVDYGDGAPIQAIAVAPDGSFALAHAFATHGVFAIVVTITDDGGAVGQTTVMATVVNQAPCLSRIQDQSVQDGGEFLPIALDKHLADPDNAPGEIVWTVTGNASLNVAVSPERVVAITYPPGTVCCERLTFTATDPAGATASRHAFFAVGAPGGDRLPPVALLEADPPSVEVGQTIALIARIEDADSTIAQVRLFGPDGNEVPLIPGAPGTHTATYPTAAVGILDFELVAADAQGNLFVDAAAVQVLAPALDDPVTVSITAPVDDATVASAVTITGTVQCRHLLEYRLETAPVGDESFTVFASGMETAFAEELGVFDPAALENGMHIIRLTATNAAGNSASTQITVNVDDQRKIGLFTLDFDDKVVPVGGPRLAITRTYDSRVKQKGDFGVGWRLSLSGIRVTENRLPCSGWTQWNTAYLWPVYDITPTVPHYATVTLNQEEMYRFEAMPYPDRAVSWPVRYLDTMDYLPLQGTKGTLEAWPTPYYTSNGIGRLDIWDQEYRLYKPQNFTYTAQNEWEYRFERESRDSLRHRLISYTDPNGVRTHILPGGLIRDDGANIVFHRDDLERITSVTDPAGKTIQYAYSLRGDLVAVTDELGNTTRFGYDRHHNLTDIVDPLGRRLTRNEYDESGRLVAVIDASGRRLEFAHDTDGRRELVRDRAGGLWVLEYDERGYTSAITDPLDNTSRFVHDARGNRLSETDPEGRTRTYAYNDNDQKIAETDPEGNTATWSYDKAGRLLQYTDFRGNTETRTYSPGGNLVSATDALGNTTAYAYDSSGNRTGLTDALGNTTTFEYGDYYTLARRTDPLGRTTEYAYDDNHRLIEEKRIWTGAAGPVEISRAFTYNDRGWPEARGDWLGNASRREYNAAGQPSALIDRLGQRTELDYDDVGRLARRRFPDGSEQTYTYDPEGRLVAQTDRDGRERRFEYDARGRIVRTIRADGASTRNEYDAAGQLVRTIDANGHATQTTYNDAGRVATVTDPLGKVTTYDYDTNGNLTSVTGPTGETTQFAYDELNRRVSTTHPDGTTENVEFDELGRVKAMTDRAGNRTAFAFDAVGNLVTTTDPAGGVTRFEYDELGNLTAVTTPRGHAVRYERDPEGRALRTQLPLGMSETSVYDAEGRRVGRTSCAGDGFVYDYDTDGRLVRRALPAAAIEETFVYSPAGLLRSAAGPGGSFTCDYDVAGRLAEYVATGIGTVRYDRDPVGNLLEMTTPSGITRYSWDERNRLASATATDGSAVGYIYDDAGRMVRAEYSNGVVTACTWDDARLLRLQHTGPGDTLLAAYDYEYAGGQRTRVTETPSGIVTDYVYDALSRLVSETITDGGTVRTIAYTYDANGNRLSRNDSGGENTAYAYDENDRMTAAGTRTLAYDANGRLTSETGPGVARAYAWDAFGRLAGVQDGATEVLYAYDPLDLRVGSTVTGSPAMRFLHDLSGLPQVVRTTDAGGTEIAAYTHACGLTFGTSGGTTHLRLADGQRNTRLLVDAAGAATDAFQFDAFGRTLARAGTTAFPFQYRAEWRDPTSGLDYLRARWYDPASGRFPSTDPIAGQPMVPGSFNPYLYALGNPVANFDPTGCVSMGELMAAQAGSSAIASMALSHMMFAICTIQVIDALIKPGAAMRYGACDLMARADNYEIQRYAMKIYDHGNTMIAFATDLIALSKNILDMANTFVGLHGTMKGMMAGETGLLDLAKDTDSYKFLLDMNSAMNSVNTSFLALARSMDIHDEKLMNELESRAQGLSYDIEESLGTVSTILGYYGTAKGFRSKLEDIRDDAELGAR